MKENFIRTMDKNTADQLISAGFKMVQNSGGCYLFLNSKTFQFDTNIDISKIRYTNVMHV